MKKELSRDIQEIRAYQVALEENYRDQVLPKNPPLVAGQAEKLARASATSEFNQLLRQFVGSKYNL